MTLVSLKLLFNLAGGGRESSGSSHSRPVVERRDQQINITNRAQSESVDDRIGLVAVEPGRVHQAHDRGGALAGAQALLHAVQGTQTSGRSHYGCTCSLTASALMRPAIARCSTTERSGALGVKTR
jgi:hypothetical protein